MYKRGTVVLVPFPFTDLSGSKVRPALIISKQTKGDVVVVFLSSKQKTKSQYDVHIKPTDLNGLKSSSLIKCEKIAALDKKVILGELGQLSKSDLQKVNNILKKLLLE